MDSEERAVRDLSASLTPALMAIPGVAAVGVERTPDGRLGLGVYVRDASAGTQLPGEVGGMPVVVHVTEPFVKQRLESP